MYAMEIEAERRREVIAGTKRDDGRGLLEGRKRRGSGTSDLWLATRQPRAREGSITAQPALRR